MTFEEDLTKRRIDVAAFAVGEPERFADWKNMYSQMHPNSFYVAVKMVINDVRRKYWLTEAVKPIAPPAAEATTKPNPRRAAVPGAIKPATQSEVVPETSEISAEIPAPPPPRTRPVIRKPPVKENTEATETTAQAPAADTSTEAPKPTARPRPVIRKPAATPNNPAEPTSNPEQIAKDDTNSAIPFHTNPTPEEALKSPRPRPVFKKPGSTPKVETAESNAVAPEATTLSTSGLDLETAAPEDTPVKPPRPRPVFKRPVSSSPPNAENADLNSEKNEPTELAPVEQSAAESPKSPRPRPVFKRPASPANPEDLEVVSNGREEENISLPESNTKEETLTSSEETITPKPPRPRPVMRRPTPAATQETPAPEPASPAATKPEAPAPTTEPQKTPRPRPIFKRPSKPDESTEQ